ncbi:Gfo/Idh/MocA family protein [Kineococcus rhizosphaerae]|uniref:Putative dehydrogenase n=1 Tax=Kineococcus rhizosphaerae TaxID=559628 RepID=A0A2T0QL10_9ACTN|nr:Gfo/Idh/MocA family oxidoreductase [Kineococcus rhizosphaerae]PRY04980.1 putative dehydrogenase [Kineococcus rhizosphaerae]
MSDESIGVAVIGAGQAGKAHAAAYRSATTLYDSVLPPVRLVTIADVAERAARAAADRFGYDRHDTSWQAVADAEDVDVVSVVVANSLHLEIVEALLAAGKHVLCEKPLSDTIQSAQAMADLARTASSVARIGFTYRRSPGIAYLRDLLQTGTLGDVYHVNGRYLTSYGSDPTTPNSWRFKGAPGTGALADLGSHVGYLLEFTGGEITSVSGGRFATVVPKRPALASGALETVENDDYASFNAHFASGAAGSLEASRVSTGRTNRLEIEVFASKGSARWHQERPSEIELYLTDGPEAQRGNRTVLLGGAHPYIAGGLPLDTAGVGFGQNEGFVFQARAFLEEVAGVAGADALPRNASFEEGLHNMVLLEAGTRSAALGGATVAVNP